MNVRVAATAAIAAAAALIVWIAVDRSVGGLDIMGGPGRSPQSTDAGGSAVVQNPASGIRTWEVGSGTLPLILLHGYGSAPEEWQPYARWIRIPASRRFVFPRGMESSSPDGPAGGRAWWKLELASYRTPGDGLPDMSRARPAGLTRSVEKIQQLMSDVEGRLGCRRDQIIVGGFSQGAMIAADLAFRTNEPIQGLVLLSGTPVDEATWIAAMPKRRGLRVFVAHGRQDRVLPFEGSRRLQQTMRDAGLRVTWVPFDGGHDIPTVVVNALNAFLADTPE